MTDEEQPTKKLKMACETTPCVATEEAATIKTCAHWVKRKKRFCKMTVAKGKEYCGEHEPAIKLEDSQQLPQDSDRIPCPLDAKHTVYKKKLQKHLKICNARPKVDLPEYIQKNINVGEAQEDGISEADLKNIKLNELEDKEFYNVINKVKELYGKYIENKIKQLNYHHSSLDEELAKAENCKESLKHLKQTSALLGILKRENAIGGYTTFIEFGAGKGQLAFYLAKLLENKMYSQVILVDRMSLRHKKDNKIENRCLVQRIRADIADFCLDKLECLRSGSFIAVSKHLCGGATDLTLRCIVQAQEIITDIIMIALCCHHRCDWRLFVGKEFFKEHLISQREFVIITKMTTWATCGTGMSRERRKALEEQQLTAEELQEIHANQRLSLAERERIGFMCKRVLDYARLHYLRQNGYEADLNYYVPKDVTLENVVLLARKIEEET